MSWRRSTDPDCDVAELRALVWLRCLPALRDEILKDLLEHNTPQSIIKSATPAIIGDVAYRALHSSVVLGRVDRAMRMIDDLDVAVITVWDDEYPARLHPLDKWEPAVLFCRGRTDLITQRSLAIVGARNSTEYGDAVAEMFATDIARRGVTVTSGLARGIDGIAHTSALAVGGGTIAVLGCGIDVDYPPANARLQERIASEGLLISEFAPGEPAMPHNFPQRNRLIALLSAAVVVIEAGPRSGTRKTVDWALEHEVNVFAVPGPIGRHESQGTNEIIQDGGHLVMSARDIFETLHWPFMASAEVARTSDSGGCVGKAREVFNQLDATSMHIDEIARRCGRSTTETLTLLTELELDGHVRQHPGKRFSRVL